MKNKISYKEGILISSLLKEIPNKSTQMVFRKILFSGYSVTRAVNEECPEKRLPNMI
jgi:hypothetical protein